MRSIILLAAPLLALPVLGHTAASPPAQGSTADRATQEIFFAVLEGLYRDGLDSESVDQIIRIDPATGYPELFVYSCPICMPAYDAFLVYRSRPAFFRRKDKANSFGAGLDQASRAQLQAADRDTRWEALNRLVERYVAQRLDDRRLTEQERADFRSIMEDFRKKGMSMLQSYQSDPDALAPAPYYPGMKACALCEAANEAASN